MIWLLTTLALAHDPVIEDHLLEVVDTLRAETPEHLPEPVRQRRLDALDLLEDYAHGGIFPVNQPGRRPKARQAHPPRAFVSGDEGRAPTFVDETGVHCAVGYLMGVDAPDLVDRVVRQANGAYLPDIQVDGVQAWAQQHGFTVDELAWIQPDYPTSVGICPTDLSEFVIAPRAVWSGYQAACGEVAFTVQPFQDPCDTCGDGHRVSVMLVNDGTAAGEADVVVRGPDSIELARVTRSLDAGTEEFFLVKVDDWRDVINNGSTVSVEAEGNCNRANRTQFEILHLAQGPLGPPDCNGAWPGNGDGDPEPSGCTAASLSSAPLWALMLAPLVIRRRR